MWPFKKRRELPSLDDLLAEMHAAAMPERTKMDRYREFRRVFLGTDEGKRVLYDILAWCHMGHSSIKPGQVIDPYDVVKQEGERRVGLYISTTLNAEPTAQPTKQRSK